MENKKDKSYENIIKMPNRNKISDSEITSLFLGLCRIVKQQALEEAKLLISGESEKNINLCKEIIKKNREIEMLKMINYQLKKKIDIYFAKNILTNKEKSTANE